MGVVVVSRLFRQVEVGKAVNTLLCINQAFLITFASLSMSGFQCYYHFEDVATTYAFPQIQCWVADHVKFVVVSLWMIFTVVVPFFVVYLYAVIKARAINHDAVASVRF